MDRNERQRKRRRGNNNFHTKKYEKTKNGFLMRAYRNMLSRVRGVTKNKNHLYLGLEILHKKDFYAFSLADNNFHKLFYVWENSGHERRLTPSIDRIDSKLGYTLDNMQWIAFSDNCRKTSRNLVYRKVRFTESLDYIGKSTC